MADIYVSRCSLEVNGANITDFKAITEKARTMRKKVNLMNKSGSANITQRYEVEADYVVPQTGSITFDAVEGGTITVEYDNGDRISYGGAACAEVGDAAIDGENELVKKIRFICETRNNNTGATIVPV